MIKAVPSSVPSTVTCRHCGTPFHRLKDEAFCCQGCAYVARLITEGGMEDFYHYKGGAVLPPVGSKVFQDDKLEWLEAPLREAESSTKSEIAGAEFSIRGLSCLGCVWLVEAVFNEMPGAVSIAINTQSASVQLRWQKGTFALAQFAKKLGQLSYRLGPPNEEQIKENSRMLVSRLALCGFFLLNVMLYTLPGYLGMLGDFFLAPLFGVLSLFFATLSLVIGGGYFFKRAWVALRVRRLHMDFPISLGIAAAYIGSVIGWLSGRAGLIYFDFVATFIFLMLLGRWLQELALKRSHAQLSKRRFRPDKVTLFGGHHDGRLVPAESLEVGVAYTVPPGGVIPVASRLSVPSASLSLEWINGEAEPLVWSRFKVVPAGAINLGSQSLALTAEESWQQSVLARLMDPGGAERHNRRLEKILFAYLSSVLTLSMAGATLWWTHGFVWTGLQVLISILVVSCPCALGVALPLADECAASTLRKQGLFVKTAEIWHRLNRVRWVVFDKTGTLTLETPKLLNPEVLNGLWHEQLLALYRLVTTNLHPVARALRETMLLHYPQIADVASANQVSLQETIGKGICWRDTAGCDWSLGQAFWQEAGEDGPPAAQAVFRQGREVVAAFYFQEAIRDKVREACDSLRGNGYQIGLLSGDAPERVYAMADRLGLSRGSVLARCTPQEKADWLSQQTNGGALMIGDGANDSLAFQQAVCTGTPVVDRALLEDSADFFFFGRSLQPIHGLLQVAKKRKLTLRFVFAVALTYNIVAVAICLQGLMHPLLAAVLMPGISIFTLACTFWGMRERKGRRCEKTHQIVTDA